ncbi:helix-turn-helix transcriptional regulator [Paracidovorax wautersii]|uniref:Transcriptional regulator, AlpA family n=1 Tax=Paracidovorax wautersii TaxID=1177982 RepID=A0A1I2E5T8_9BURK|nr:hypothetical protein [Paracidovorax wautersii]SFE87989.1 hypothetical protein SAMN04489711_106235 [Paracidovorax wautersii]
MATHTDTAARVDTAGIAAMLGCTRAHVTDRLTKRPDFPKPFINVSQKMRYWRLGDVQAFLQGKRGTR